MDILVHALAWPKGESCQGECAPTARWAYNVPVGNERRLLCHLCAVATHNTGGGRACDTFDAGDMLSAYRGRRCINCAAREQFHETAV